MNTDPDRLVRLPARRLLHVDGPAALRIECREGSVWITLDHDPRDIVLDAGETFEHDGRQRALVYAFEAAAVLLRPPQPLQAPAYPPGQQPRTTAQVAV